MIFSITQNSRALIHFTGCLTVFLCMQPAQANEIIQLKDYSITKKNPLTPPQLQLQLQLQPEHTNSTEQWIDQQHGDWQHKLQQQANRMDSWFGVSDERPARAVVRIFLDTTWDKFNQTDASVRIRGSLKLPNASKRFRLMFGDDTLEEERSVNNLLATQSQPASKNTTSSQSTPKTKDVNQQALTDNASFALRWLVPARHGLRADLDLGIRSGTDVYTRAEVGKTWPLQQADTRLLLDQTLRYGSKSEWYARTDLEWQYQPAGKPLLSNLGSISYADADDEKGVAWSDRLSYQHRLAQQQTLSYGLLVAGRIQDTQATLNMYGPWLSYRQPFLRDWFFVRGDVNYFNDRTLDRSHYVSALLRLEAVF